MYSPNELISVITGTTSNSQITGNIDLLDTYKVENAIDPTNNQDYITLSYGNSHYTGSGVVSNVI